MQKIHKFKEVNFKIIHGILATPFLISKIRKNPELAKCFFCGEKAKLGHILLKYPWTKQLQDWVVQVMELETPLNVEQWILGHSKAVNPVLWLLNFALIL